MISDTEDWSNDADNSALHHNNKLHFKNNKIENGYFKLYSYFTILLILVYQINATLVNIRLLFKNIKTLNVIKRIHTFKTPFQKVQALISWFIPAKPIHNVHPKSFDFF